MKKHIIIMICTGLFFKSIGQNTSDTINLKDIELDELIFSANKSEENKSDVPYQIKILKSKEIEFTNSQNSADMLTHSGTVFVQKSQQGGGSPSLRGFEANRLLLVVDGIRMNNAIYRSGHIQDVITIDNSILDRTEIIFGPSSTIYGSDALGGVIHFYTKKPNFSDNKFRINPRAFTRWSFANKETTTHLDLNLGWKRIASFTSITHSSFGNLRAGARRNPFYENLFKRKEYIETINGIDSIVQNPNVNVQIQSAYSQYDLLQKISFKQSKQVIHTLNFQYSNSSDIPRYDRLSEYSNGNLRFAEWYYGPQKRLLTSLHSNIASTSRLFSKLNIILAYQQIKQERVNRIYRDNNKTLQSEEVKVYSLNADFFKKVNFNHDLHYGLEANYNDVQSNANSLNILTNISSPAPTRYPDGGSNMLNYAFYLSHKWNISQKLILNEGIRYNKSILNSKFIETKFFPFPFTNINQKNNAFTGNIGLVYKASNKLSFSLVGSSGFRTPNVDDLTKIFDSTPGILVVANPDLKPEFAYNLDLGILLKWNSYSTFSINTWHSKLINAMVLKNFQYNGQDSVLYNGLLSQVQAMQNSDEAFTQGLSGEYTVNFNSNFALSSALTYTYGSYRNVLNNTRVPFDHISPVFGKTALKFKTKKSNSEFSVVYNGWKYLKDYSPSGEDNLQFATPYGMPSWLVLNYKYSINLNQNFTLQTGIENILDTHYRYFASGISAAGRNVYFTLRVQL